jgi:outer membrane protein assembly factor BamB
MKYFLLAMLFSNCSHIKLDKFSSAKNYFFSSHGVVRLANHGKYPGSLNNISGWVAFDDNLVGVVKDKKNWLTSLKAEGFSHNWWYLLKGDITAPLVENDGYFYLGYQTGLVEKISGESGRLIWQQRDLDSGVFRSISVGDKKVFVITSKNTLYCLDGENGNINWSYDFSQAKSLQISGQSAAKIVGDLVYIVDCENHLHCVNKKDGSFVWKINIVDNKDFELSGSIGSLFKYNDNLIIALYSGDVVAVKVENISEPKIVWHRKISEGVVTSFVSQIDNSYIGVKLGNKNYIHKLENSSGHNEWKQEIFDTPYDISFAGGGFLLVSGGRGLVQVLLKSDGRSLAREYLGATVLKPLWYKNKIFIPVASGSIYIFERNFGATRSAMSVFMRNKV